MTDPKHSRFSHYPTFEQSVDDPSFSNIFIYLAQKFDIPGYLTDNKIKFHYTNAAGLLGIIESNRIWATDIKFLNDPSEGIFFSDSIFESMKESAGVNNKTHAAILSALHTHLLQPINDAGVFSVSFCDDGDLLSQWRAYGSFGIGYAVGFKIQTPGLKPWIAYRIKYSTAGIREIGQELLKLYTAIVSKHGPSAIDEHTEGLADVLRTLSVSFKSDAYDEEKETRIVTVRDHKAGDELEKLMPVKFRTRHGDLIPYIPLALQTSVNDVAAAPKLPIVEIVIGPGVNAERNMVSIRKLLQINGYGHVEIRASNIPFRP